MKTFFIFGHRRNTFLKKSKLLRHWLSCTCLYMVFVFPANSTNCEFDRLFYWNPQLVESKYSPLIENESKFGLNPRLQSDAKVIDLFGLSMPDCAVHDCFIFTSVTPISGGYRICFSSLYPSSTHSWTLYQAGVGNVGTSTNSSDCFTITGGGNLFSLSYSKDGTFCDNQAFLVPTTQTCSSQGIFSEVDTCDFIADIDLIGYDGDYPIVVNHGDGTPLEIISSDSWQHQYPINEFDTYSLCITYCTPSPNYPDGYPTIQTCCYPVAIICCDTSNFEFNQIVVSGDLRSCINPMFEIIPECTEDVIADHYWFFSDGKTFEGPNPPSPYRFTDFVNDTGYVCVTHMIVCCEDTMITTHCLPHPTGAYLGEPNEERYLTDPILPWASTVYNFIGDLADNLSIPLLIDGTLIIDRPALFDNTSTTDYWNMGDEAIIRNVANSISLTRVNVQSASRLNSLIGRSYNCCRWVGFESDKRTTFRFRNDTISDANFMLHYNGDQTPTNPTLWAENNLFHTNIFGIKSIGQNLKISRFHGNNIVGADHDLVLCDCGAINAIDFRGILYGPTVPVIFPDSSVNTISRYEQGFHFHNASLVARNFHIDSMQNYPDMLAGWDNLSDAEAGIGIYYIYDRPLPSRLEIDKIHFENYSPFDGASAIAVFDSVELGHHILYAVASTPLTSILMENLTGGYRVRNRGTIYGVIRDNLIEPSGFGINSAVWALGNTLRIEENTINNNGGSLPSGGITLSSMTIPSITQNFRVRLNTITNNSDGGSGIFINHAESSLVEHNILEESSSVVDGIVLNRSNLSELRCNSVTTFRNAIQSDLSEASQYSANEIDFNQYSMVFTGDNNGIAGSNIRWNTFSQSNNPDIQYNSMDWITGIQKHTMYNSWIDQSGAELFHLKTFGFQPSNCRFYYPSSAALGSVHRPNRNTSLLQEPTSDSAENLPSGYCALPDLDDPNDGGGQLTEPIDNGVLPDTFYANLLTDTSFWSGISSAQGDALKQRLMSHLEDNPTWMTSNVTLEDFYEDEDTTFIGRSVAIEQEMESILTIQDSFLTTLTATRLEMDSLAVLVDSLFQLAAITSDTTTQNSLRAQGTAISNELDTLADEMETISELFYNYRDTLIDDLKTMNDNLQDNSLHKLYEKTVNAILIHIWQDSVLTSTQKDDIRDIAGICYDDGGRAVFMARGLCWTMLNEYYHEDSCQAYVAPRIAAPVNNLITGVFLQPNPANERVTILLDESWQDETLDIIITDIVGRTIQQHRGLDGATRKIDLRTDQMHNGNYFILLQGKIKSESVILSIQR